MGYKGKTLIIIFVVTEGPPILGSSYILRPAVSSSSPTLGRVLVVLGVRRSG
jgi:hypothetical protein